MVPGDDGFFQHPNVSHMDFDEYPEFISDPFAFIVEKMHPRVFGILRDDPKYGYIRMQLAAGVTAAQSAGMRPKLIEQFQRSSSAVPVGTANAPFDYIADYIRSFSDIVIDMRRKPQWVLDACEGALALQTEELKKIKKPAGSIIPTINTALHMAPYLKPKDFEKFWWPGFKTLAETMLGLGLHPVVFAEQNWDPHFEAFNDIKGHLHISFESTDPQLAADKLGKQHHMSHFYPSGLFRSASAEECIDEAKRLLDILAPGGRYIFAPNRPLIRKGDGDVRKVAEVAEFVREYGVY